MVTAPSPPLPPPSPSPPPSPPRPPKRPGVKWTLSAPATPEAVRAALVIGNARKGLGVSIAALSRQAGFSRSYLSQLERGVLGLTPKSSVKLFAALGVLTAERVAAAIILAAGKEAKEAGDAPAAS